MNSRCLVVTQWEMMSVDVAEQPAFVKLEDLMSIRMKEGKMRKARRSGLTIAMNNNLANRNTLNIPASSIGDLLSFSSACGVFWCSSLTSLTFESVLICFCLSEFLKGPIERTWPVYFP